MDMNYNSQSPNPINYENPNIIDPRVVPDRNNQLDVSMYNHIANYLLFDEDYEGSGRNDLLSKDTSDAVFKNIIDNSEGSSNSIQVASQSAEMNKHDTKEDHRFAFKTKTDLEFMDDGYKWRKYGKKKVKNSPSLRNYFKCSSDGCGVKKRVERDSEDPSYVITTYQGLHNHT